jgi:thiol-disulfide isomerase/thioredoxin
MSELYLSDVGNGSFLSFVGRDGVTAVLFESPECSVCRAVRPVFEQVAGSHREARFGVCDVSVEPELARRLEISYLPTLLVAKRGVLVFRQPGRFSGEEIGRIIEYAQQVDLERLRAEAERGSEAQVTGHSGNTLTDVTG